MKRPMAPSIQREVRQLSIVTIIQIVRKGASVPPMRPPNATMPAARARPFSGIHLRTSAIDVG